MSGTYKYNPDDFNGMLGMSGELVVFYTLYESDKKEKTQNSRFALKNHWEDLFLTIKHREVEGFLNPSDAHDIREYLEVLVND
jgi:hypothetical protein